MNSAKSIFRILHRLRAGRGTGKDLERGLKDRHIQLIAIGGADYWLRAFGAEVAGGEVTGLERYEVVSSEAWRVLP